MSIFNINGKPIEMPTGWHGITVELYHAIMNDAKAGTYDCLGLITGVDPKQLPQWFGDAAITMLGEAMAGELPTEPVSLINGNELPSDIGSLEFARKVNADIAISKIKDPIEVALLVVASYLADGIDDSDIDNAKADLAGVTIPELWGAFLFINGQMKAMAEQEAKMPTFTPTNDEYRAGVDVFKKYGIFALVRQLALRYGQTFEQVYAWSYNQVMLELRYSTEEAIYTRRLHEILNRK